MDYQPKLIVPLNVPGLKLCENSPFQIFQINHHQRKNYQSTLIFMVNQRMSLKKSDLMKYDNILVFVIQN